MSLTISICFLKDHKRHDKIIDAVQKLKELNIKYLPIELASYFGTDDPEQALCDTDDRLKVGNSVLIDDEELPSYVTRVASDDRKMLEIDIAKLPDTIKHIRFTVS